MALVVISVQSVVDVMSAFLQRWHTWVIMTRVSLQEQ